MHWLLATSLNQWLGVPKCIRYTTLIKAVCVHACVRVCVCGGGGGEGWGWLLHVVALITSLMAKCQQQRTCRADHPADLQSRIPKTTKAELSFQGRRLWRRPLSQSESMTCNRQSRKDPVSPMKPKQSFVFVPKSNTRIGCWNMRSIGNPTKYFELKNSWGCPPNSNYCLISDAIGNCIFQEHIKFSVHT